MYKAKFYISLSLSLSFFCAVGSASDNVYFAANFRGTDSMSYDISYQQVTFGPSGETVNTSRLYGWQQGDMYWLACESMIITLCQASIISDQHVCLHTFIIKFWPKNYNF